MKWSVKYLPEAVQDLKKLDGSQRAVVMKAIRKVSANPLPASEGGYGKPLGNVKGTNLTNLLKIKLRGPGIRVVYQLQRTETEMLIIIIGARADDEVYKDASNRMSCHVK